MLKNSALRTAAIAVVILSARVLAADLKPVSVPAGDLTSALESLAKQAGVELVYRPEQLRGLQTKGVQGTLSSEEAVRKLIEGTVLTLRADPSGVLLISVDEPVQGYSNPSQGSDSRVAQASASQGSESTQAEAGGDASKLEEIVVTAQKRGEQRLIDTPISIGVLSGDALDGGSSRGITDVLNQVGGVTVTEIQPGQVAISVRGAVPGAGSSTTAYYQDEVPFTFIRNPELPDANAFDLARVEILRGPQGTLYGANSVSGVVRVLTNDANLNAFEVKGRTRASSTEDGGGNFGGDAAVNVPIIAGKLAVRAVASYSELSGFIDSRLDGQRDINDAEAQNYRLKANYQPNESLSIKLGYSRSQIENGAPSNSLDDFSSPFSSSQPDERVQDTFSLIGEYTWPSVSLQSLTGFIDYETSSQREQMFGASPISLLIVNTVESFSQELRLVSHLQGRWQWSAGAFYKDTQWQTYQDVRPVFPAVYISDVGSESYALFGEGTRSFGADKYELTAGLRYFNDTETLGDVSNFFPAQALLPDRSAEFNRVTGRLVFAYKPKASSMLYGSVATGFRSGLQPTSAVTAIDPSFQPVDPDSMTSYEVGTKGRLLGSGTTYDVAVYYTAWKDLQQFLFLPNNFSAPVNSGAASGVGVDATVSYPVTEALTLHGSVGWNDLKMDEEVISRGLVLFEKDSRVNDSPEWTGSIGADYRMTTPRPGLNVVLSSNFAYGSERVRRFLAGTVINQSQSDGMRLLKASAGLEGGNWSLDVFGDNLLNDDAAVAPPDATFANTAVRLRPRTIGIQVTFDY